MWKTVLIIAIIIAVVALAVFSIVRDNEWLGDFLKRIRDCDVNSPLDRLKGDIYDKISDIKKFGLEDITSKIDEYKYNNI